MSKIQKKLSKRCPICGSYLEVVCTQKKQLEYGEEIYIDQKKTQCPECDYIERGRGKDRNRRPNFKGV